MTEISENESDESLLKIEEKTEKPEATEIKAIKPAETKEKAEIIILSQARLRIEDSEAQLMAAKTQNERIIIGSLVLVIILISALSFFLFRKPTKVEANELLK
jgi:hypothetical protein